MECLFITAKSVRVEVDATGVRTPSAKPVATSYMLKLYLPHKPGKMGSANPHVYPKGYVRTLCRSTHGTVTDDTVMKFNRSSEGQAAIAAAKAEFDQALNAAVKRCPDEGCILLADVPDLLGISPATLKKWIAAELIEAFDEGGRQLVDAEKLRGKLEWNL